MKVFSIIIALVLNNFTASTSKLIDINESNLESYLGRPFNKINKKNDLNKLFKQTDAYPVENDTIVKINYRKQNYNSKVNLIKNSNFGNELKSWDSYYLSSPSKDTLVSIENISGKNWLKFNCTNNSNTAKQGYLEQIVNIPPLLRNSILEFSFDVFGYFQKVTINDQAAGPYNIVIPASNPERIYMYIRPNGQKTVSVKLFKCISGQEILGQNVYFSNIQLVKAKYNYNTSTINLPKTGLNLQLARWITDWNPEYQDMYLQKISKEISPLIRVWLSSELFANYIDKPRPVKRDVNESFLSESYNSLDVGKIPSGFNDNIKKVDWFFKKCKELGIKLHITLGSGFTDGKGNPHQTLNVRGLYEFLDSDDKIQKALTAYFGSIVKRYKNYNNIIGYELLNEGYFTWRSIYAGYNSNASFSTIRSLSFAGYKTWERETFATIKKIDPKRPIILNLVLNETNLQYLATDNICNWFCPSFYGGKLKITSGDISNDSFKADASATNSLGTINNGYKVIAYTDSGNLLPTGIETGKTYYIINLTNNSFQISDTPAGDPIHISGGKGVFYFYSPDGSLIDVDSPVLERLKDCNKFVYFSEFGAPTIGKNLLYRDEKINAAHINKMMSLLKKYHISSVINYDEHNLFFNRNFTNKQTTNQLITPRVKE